MKLIQKKKVLSFGNVDIPIAEVNFVRDEFENFKRANIHLTKDNKNVRQKYIIESDLAEETISTDKLYSIGQLSKGYFEDGSIYTLNDYDAYQRKAEKEMVVEGIVEKRLVIPIKKPNLLLPIKDSKTKGYSEDIQVFVSNLSAVLKRANKMLLCRSGNRVYAVSDYEGVLVKMELPYAEYISDVKELYPFNIKPSKEDTEVVAKLVDGLDDTYKSIEDTQKVKLLAYVEKVKSNPEYELPAEEKKEISNTISVMDKIKSIGVEVKK